MSQPTTLTEEFTAATRGFLALLTGNRAAPGFFDFSQRGLAGSFLALIAATLVTAYGPLLIGGSVGSITRAVMLSAVLLALQLGVIYVVLRAMGRQDGFIPYLVADNWTTLFISVITVVGVGLLGAGDMALIVIGLVAIVVEINIARLIVTLAPMQIVMFIAAQFAAQFMGIVLFADLIPT